MPEGCGPTPRLLVAQDTGTAIVGRARGDLFIGSGEDAGHAAGSVRHPARFTVLLPRDDMLRDTMRGRVP